MDDSTQLRLIEYLDKLEFPSDYSNIISNIKSVKVENHINIIVGSNDSGKSYFLRNIINSLPFYELRRKIICDVLDRVFMAIQDLSIKKSLIDVEINISINNRTQYNELSQFVNDFNGRTEIKKVNDRRAILLFILCSAYNNNNTDLLDSIIIKPTDRAILDEILKDVDHHDYKPFIYFSPTQRTLLNNIIQDNWEFNQRLQWEIPKEKDMVNKRINWFNGNRQGEIINKLKNSIKRENSDLIKDFESLLSSYFFDGKKIELKKPTDYEGEYANEIYIDIEGEKDNMPIYKLGEGLQQIIILLWHLLYSNKAGIVLIEEPELQLHPGYQKQFIRVLSEHPLAKRFIYYITTHSNHIIDALNFNNQKYTLYHTSKKGSDLLVNVSSTTDLQKIFNSIGIHNSSVLLANCSIWVEGNSDYIYYNSYLRVYLNEIKDFRIKEGLHYAFLMSNGNNLVHYIFSDSSENSEKEFKFEVHTVCGSPYVILDGDTDEKWDEKKLDEFGINDYLRLSVKEVENTLRVDVFVKAIKQVFPTITSDNMPLEKDFEEGNFANLVKEHYGIKTAAQKKVQIAREASTLIKYENMTDMAKEVTKKLYEFVCKENGLKPKH